MREQVLNKNHLPPIFDLNDQAVGTAFDVEHCHRINKIGVRVNFLDVNNACPGRVRRDLVPFSKRRF